MKLTDTAIPDVKIIEPQIFGDQRGFFFESFRASWLEDQSFVQDNHSKSIQFTLRGLHYQRKNPQGKLIRVLQGRVLDVAVDLRKSSPSLGKHVAVELNDENHHMLWVPPGFAHGFVVLSETAEFFYKCTNYYSPVDERAIRWDDPELGIDWQLSSEPILSEKDRIASSFAEAELFE